MTDSFKNPDSAFDFAIATGRLSVDEAAENYAGKFMYMGTAQGRDRFKNKNTREYI